MIPANGTASEYEKDKRVFYFVDEFVNTPVWCIPFRDSTQVSVYDILIRVEVMVIGINGHKKEIPDCFERLTARQWELLVPELAKEVENRDHFAIFNILAETSFKDFHATAENEVTIWNAIRWIYEQPISDGEIPKVLQIGKRIVTISKRIQNLSIGQNIHLKQLIAGATYVEENICAAVAIYLQPLYDNDKFDYDKALELKGEIEKMPAWLIRPIGFFLLTSVSLHGRKQTSNWQRILNNLMQRCARMLPLWLRSQGSYLSRI